MKNAQTKVIDLQDEVDRLDDEIEDVLDEAEDLDTDSDEFEEQDVLYKALNTRQKQFEELVEERGAKFEIRELSFGEITHIRDDVLAHSEDAQNPREGLYKTQVLEKGVVDSPAGFSDDPRDWPPVVGEYVYEQIDALNSGVDEQSLGNFSLADDLQTKRTSQ